MSIVLDNIPDAYSQTTTELMKVLGSIDPIYCDIIVGIERVLNDKSNPDRYVQAANSIRGLTGRLVRSVEPNIPNSDNAQLSKALTELSKGFDEALKHMPQLSAKNDRESQINGMKEEFNCLKKNLKTGKLTLRLKIKQFFGKDDEMQNLPTTLSDEMKNVIKVWADTNAYFVKITHYSDDIIDTSVFIDNWYTIQSCILQVVTPFVRQIPILDSILQKDEPPNG
jgi:hypothetical protein